MAFVAVAAAVEDDKNAQVLRSDSRVGADSYEYAYETSNGINGQASGQLKNFGPEQDAVVSNGAFGWVDPEGHKWTLTYVADENGYQPQGDALPTPPPIPVEIARALKWMAEHPPAPETQKH